MEDYHLLNHPVMNPSFMSTLTVLTVCKIEKKQQTYLLQLYIIYRGEKIGTHTYGLIYFMSHLYCHNHKVLLKHATQEPRKLL